MTDPRSSAVTEPVRRVADYLYVEMEKLDAPITMTACLALAKHILALRQPGDDDWHRELIDREPDHGQYRVEKPAGRALLASNAKGE